jgi:hypothetical protein
MSNKQSTYIIPAFQVTKQIMQPIRYETAEGYDELIVTEGLRLINGERQKWRYFQIRRHYDGQIYLLPEYGHIRIK